MSDIDDAICVFNDEEESDGWEDSDSHECDAPVCVFPGKCVMPGEHFASECHTAEMMQAIADEQGSDQRASLRVRGENS